MKVFITNNDALSICVSSTKDVHVKLYNFVVSVMADDKIPLNPEIEFSGNTNLLFELKGLKNNILYYEFLGEV